MPGDYRVDTSGAAKDDFRRLLDAARQGDILAEAAAAARWLMSDLERTPMEMGESRDDLPYLRLHRRIAFARPVVVRYAVHEDSKTVFVLRFGLTGL